MSSKKRRQWKPAEKLRLVLEAMQSNEKIAEICRREGVSPTQIYEWRRQLMSSAETVFARQTPGKGEDPRIGKLASDNQRMKNVIAEITAENLELKKTLSD